MKITKSQLRSLVQEELKSLSEDDWPKKVKKGRFTDYCKGAGFDGPGIGCAEKAMDSSDDSVRGMASFYMNTVKPKGKDASDVAEENLKLTKEALSVMIEDVLEEKDWIQKVDKEIKKDGTKGVCTGKKFGGPTCRPGTQRYNLAKTFRKMNEVTAGAEKFADFEAIAQAYRADKTDRKAKQEMVYYVEDVVSPEMENLGLRDTATDSAKSNGLFDWSAPKDEPYKNASIDLYGDGYEVEVYPSSNDDDMQTTTTETLMDAINFVRGVLSSEGAAAPGEDPAQMELPLQESRKIKIRRKKK